MTFVYIVVPFPLFSCCAVLYCCDYVYVTVTLVVCCCYDLQFVVVVPRWFGCIYICCWAVDCYDVVVGGTFTLHIVRWVLFVTLLLLVARLLRLRFCCD